MYLCLDACTQRGDMNRPYPFEDYVVYLEVSAGISSL